MNNNLKKAMPYAAAAGVGLIAGAITWSKLKTAVPKGATPVDGFDLDRYQGQWFEIARFDYRFERGLQNVAAYYFLNGDGSVRVVNRGQETATGEWKESVGKAKFITDEHTGRLKVSFFGPLYAAYNIIAIAGDYEYALVAGHNLDYLWLLSRTPEMPPEIQAEFLEKAAAIGYDVSRLVWTKQDS